MKSLPARPSLESLRKQAKRLARDIAAGDSTALARARVHLPNAQPPLTQRNAQFVIAREYGYQGWQDLTADVHRRLGTEIDWAAQQARRAIHDNDIDRLQQLLAEHPALLSWTGDDDENGLLGFATGAYGDAGNPERERWFTRGESAELLIDAGAVVTPAVCQGILQSRARGLLQLFHRKGLLPPTLPFLAALGDLESVRRALDEPGDDLALVNQAFVVACGFHHEAVASCLLDRSIALDPELAANVDGVGGRDAILEFFLAERSDVVREMPAQARALGLWKAFAVVAVGRALEDDDLTAFLSGLQRERWLLSEDWVTFQNEIIAQAAFLGRGEFITALLDLDPAILRREPPLPTQAFEFAATYAHTDVIPLLTRIWPLPDDLPHAAAVGDLARVKRWFDQSGAPALGDLDRHYPANDPRARSHLGWYPRSAQQVLDVALAWAVINRHFDVADFLLERGADINTNWNSHEPASILHHLVFLVDGYDAMRYLIDRGIDMTIKDYRWNSDARGWALYGRGDEKMARWLTEVATQRQR